MGVNLYNSERYADPTAYQALNNIMREDKKKRGADMKANECFALERGRCTALNVRDCSVCGFYKTKEQNRLECEKAMNRIRSLGVDLVRHITDKYYINKK